MNCAKMAPDATYFTLVHGNCSGKPDFIYPWDGKLAACVMASINVCRGMLCDTKMRSGLVSMTREWNRDQPRPWYDDPRHGLETLDDVVTAFINSILAVFPIVVIDDSMANGSCLGVHFRREWDTYFRPRDQSILLNASVRGELDPRGCEPT